MLGIERAVSAEVFGPYHRESSMYANTTYDIVAHSQIPLLMFLLLEDLPVYLPYLYIIVYYYSRSKQKKQLPFTSCQHRFYSKFSVI